MNTDDKYLDSIMKSIGLNDETPAEQIQGIQEVLQVSKEEALKIYKKMCMNNE